VLKTQICITRPQCVNNVQYINTVQETLNILRKLVAIEIQEGNHKTILTNEEIYKPSHSQNLQQQRQEMPQKTFRGWFM